MATSLVSTGVTFPDGTTQTTAASAAFPAGTVMLFVQTAAPTGWTKSVTHDNKALRVVSGTVGSGGSVAFTTVFGRVATDAHTLTTSEMPSHNHSAPTNSGTGGHGWYYYSAGDQYGSSYAGGGGSHSHSIDMRVQYVDVIVATKG